MNNMLFMSDIIHAPCQGEQLACASSTPPIVSSTNHNQ